MFYQKILMFNWFVPWPVHFTSFFRDLDNIEIGTGTFPGLSPHCYLQGNNGIIFGNNVRIAPGCTIISSNHDPENYSKHIKCGPIRIGNNVWLGANAVILPTVQIGDNVVIGAGSVVTTDIPPNSIAVGNPCRVIKEKGPYKGN